MNNKKSKLSVRRNIAPLIFFFFGIAVNLLLGTIVSALELPLYLDTVGTVIVAVIGGAFPGVMVGFATNIIKSLSDPSSLYYGVLNVLIALASAHLAKHKRLKTAVIIPLMIIVLTLIGGGLGTLIPWFMEGLAFDSESLSGKLYSTGHFSQAAAHLLASILTDLPDKAITVVLAYLFYRLVPEKKRRKLRFTSWRQKPIDKEEITRNDNGDVRQLSLRIKMLIVFIISLSTVAVVGTVISVRVYYKTIVNEHSDVAWGTAKLAAKEIDGDRIEEYLESGGNSDEYKEKQQLLEDILYSSPEITYLYVYKMEQDGIRVVFDVDTEEVKGDEAGELIPYENSLLPLKGELLAGKETEPLITNDKYGTLLTAMQPVYDSDGKCVCYACADVDMNMLAGNTRSFLTEMITVFLSFLIMICALVIWLADFHIIFPIRSITMHINKISHSGDTQENLDRFVSRINALQILTGDEIEQLYISLCGMTVNQAEQMRSIRRLSDSTAKMQDGLISTMANMVENRDSNTGAHIQKTAAYVGIIVRGLRKMGYYSEEITDKFISDVVRSAPLHDVGKIKIPDCVLNKPGKLTPEEFEVMKTHTSLGREIMEHVIVTVEGDSYLEEARNMAAFHHERWDGKGYPYGLHDTEIPLSARIMAVADVFDALTSARVYKPAFPLEKAVSIIEEGKGTQFDPKCVEVFLGSLDEVRAVLEIYKTK